VATDEEQLHLADNYIFAELSEAMDIFFYEGISELRNGVYVEVLDSQEAPNSVEDISQQN
jgi:hypothetical protein